ncbi:MAG: methyltransferase domain-containing protein [Candidatus Doudnabacteria bacterium]|nr:methyltransferase domain-containing protein [Candidatus Doudnabacteria bacterium]
MSKFLNPSEIVAQMGLMQGQTVADLGCGNGFYVLPVAQLVGGGGIVWAIDVMEAKLAATVSISNQFGYRNVRILQADLSKPILDIPAGSCDAVVIGNILHEISDKEQLLKNAYRFLKSSGKLLVVEWKKALAPMGPSIDKKIDQTQAETWLMNLGLRKLKELNADNYHYGLLFEKI